MGQTPAKMFNPPTPFGSSPQTNNVQQAQPLTQVQGPGFAATGAFDQTQQAPQSAPTGSLQSPLFASGGMGAGSRVLRQFNSGQDFNPFAGGFGQ